MAYIGPIPAETFTSFATQEFSTSATTSYTLDHPVTNENEIALFINNVRQQPGSGKAYTATGTALTLSAATASTDTMYAVFLGRALQTVNPADASVGTSQLAATSVTAAKLNNDIISGTTALAEAPADTDEFLVSDAGTLKRIDYSLIKGGGMFEKLITTTISSATANITFNNTYLTTAHRDYRVVFTGMKPATDNKRLTMVISDDNGSSFKGGSDYEYRMKEMQQGNSGFGQNDSANNSKFELTVDGDGNGTGEALHGHIDIFDPLNQNSDSQFFSWQADLVYFDSDGDNNYVFGNGYYKSSGTESTVFNAIKFAYASGNILSGSATLYGRKI
jgi:hypothetical protein|tara:strand:+ start:475 stop:1476 length:1002 start_codon:yes stop_codon:yes gene_type:complete